MMLVTVKDMSGNQVGEANLDSSVFSAPINNALMHQALVRQLANARLGTHKTKGRSEVRGGGRKPWKQKGTGRARQGSTRAPNWVGGGTVFGPQPRKYTKSMPRKMRRSALRSALSVKAGADQIVVVDKLAMDTPKTKAVIGALDSLGVAGNSVLMVIADKSEALQRSANNLPYVKTLNAAYLNIHDLLGHDTVLLSSDALELIEAWLSEDVVEYEASSEVDSSEAAVEASVAEEAVVEEVPEEAASEDEAESAEASTDEGDEE